MNSFTKINKIILGLLSIILISGCTGLSISTKQPIDGGIFKSTDFGENWSQKAQAIASADMRFVVFDPKDENVMYLSMNGAGIYKSVDKGDTWQGTPISTSTFQAMAIDNTNTNVIYVIKDNKIIKTVDGMNNWFDTYIEIRPGQTLVNVLTDPIKSNILYAATTTSLIKSTDYGNTWKLLNWSQPSIINIYQSKKNSSTLYALTDKGIFKTINGGVDWLDNNLGLSAFPSATTINWVDFDANTETMFIGTNTQILLSTDGATTWTEIPTLFEFGKVPIKAIIHNPADLNEVIFPYNNTILKTNNGGKTWKSLKSISTSRLITYLAVNPYQFDSIYAGTTLPPKKK
jgi:photosystem II stability/assembly factor-like uncharacterized protein